MKITELFYFTVRSVVDVVGNLSRQTPPPQKSETNMAFVNSRACPVGSYVWLLSPSPLCALPLHWPVSF